MTDSSAEIDRKIPLGGGAASAAESTLAEDALLAVLGASREDMREPPGKEAAQILSLLTDGQAGRWLRRLDVLCWQLALDPRRALPGADRPGIPLGGQGVRIQDNHRGSIFRRGGVCAESAVGSAFVCGPLREELIPCFEAVAAPTDEGELPVGTIVRIGPASPGMGRIEEAVIDREPVRE